MVEPTEVQNVPVTPTEPEGAGQQETQTPAEKTFTQAELDKLVGQARAEGRKAAQEALAKQLGGAKLEDLIAAANELAKRKEAEMSDQEKYLAEIKRREELIAAKEQEAEAARLKVMRLEVGLAKGLKPSIADLLKGTTREEIEAHADTVIAELPVPPATPKPVPPNLGPTEGNQGTQRPAVRLTQAQKELAAQFGITEERYAQRFQEGKSKEG